MLKPGFFRPTFRYPRRRSVSMALYLAAGDRQTAPSTPGVFLPLLCVTRFTANARPWKEWVSSHCRAFTLP